MRPLLLAAGLAAAALLPGSPPADAGCLAPADVLADSAGTIGPFWGNDAGELLYARGLLTSQELVRRGLGQFPDTIAQAGDRNGFLVGASEETWSAFHVGAINDRGDAAFVASTTLDDDPDTLQDESIARRGAYALQGNTISEIGRFGGPSPVFDLVENDFVPWGSFFDAVPVGRPDGGRLRVVFSAQLGGSDGRQGLFLWESFTEEVTTLVLAGESSPAGAPYRTFGTVRVNEAGDVVFYALTRFGDSDPIAPGLFRIDRTQLGPDPGVVRVVRFGLDGETHEGIGRLSLRLDFDVDDAGDVLFASLVEDGPAAPSALLRWSGGVVATVLREGDATPLGATLGSFAQASVRADEEGRASLLAPLVGGPGGVGFFTIARGGTALEPLGAAPDALALASLGDGRVAYQTEGETRTIVPADGTEEGPKDFRVAALDLRNVATPAKDSLLFDVRFRLLPWGTGGGQAPPAVFSPLAERSSPAKLYAANELARIAEVRVRVSENTGQRFLFGIGGTAEKPVGTFALSTSSGEQDPGSTGAVKRFTLSKNADAASWTFTHAIGAGTFSIDLTKGTARLVLRKGNVHPSFSPLAFPVEMTLRTVEDVVAARHRAAAYFHRAVRLDADQPDLANGRRVVSKGERLDGGTFFVDVLRVDRSLKVVRGQAAPQVTSDRIALSGTVRLCPGSTAPSTPTILADVTVGDLALTDVVLARVGKTGSKYSGRATAGALKATLTVDVVKGTVAFSASGVPPLPQLVDADFASATSPNSAKRAVGGMTLPVTIRVDRVYETTTDVGMTRLPGGKAFTR